MAKLVLLVLCATSASARHLLEVNSYLAPSSDDQVRRNPDTILERRNIEFGSDVNLNQYGLYIQPVHTRNSMTNKHLTSEIPFRINNLNHGVSDGVYSTNNVVSNNEYELKTNVYTSDNYYTTENSIEYIVRTNVDVEMHTQRKNAHQTQENYSTETTTLKVPNMSMYNRNEQGIGVLKTNKNNVTNRNQQPKMDNTNLSPNPKQQNNFMNQEGSFANKNTNTPNGRRIERPRLNKPEGGATKYPAFNTTRPIPNRVKPNKTDSMPGKMDEAEEENGWVWGDMDTTTLKDDLDNRAAFDGDKCPSGKVKTNGMCVDKH